MSSQNPVKNLNLSVSSHTQEDECDQARPEMPNVIPITIPKVNLQYVKTALRYDTDFCI